MSRLPQLRASLLAAAERQAKQRRTQARDAGAPTPRRLRRGVPALVALVALLPVFGAAAFAASELIATGAAVKAELMNKRAGIGVAISHSPGLLGIAAPDPGGGPPWTMRAFRTSRGLGCVQVGRLLDGRIGELGRDGAFDDDGRFHPLPPQVGASWNDCVLLDARGRTFLAMSVYGAPASGAEGSCARGRCPVRDVRDLFFGLLGPDARSVTYTLHGRLHRVATVGGDGAYLIVLPADARSNGLHGAITSGIVPAGGGEQPIRSVAYTGGRTCTITVHGDHDQDGGRCRPIGYAPVHTPLPSARELASGVRVERLRGRHEGRSRLEVSFTARVAVRNARSAYAVAIYAPRGGLCAGVRQSLESQAVDSDVRAGQRLHVYFSATGDPGSLFEGCWGRYHGEIYYLRGRSGPSRVTLAGAAVTLLLQHRHALGLAAVPVARFGYRVTRAEATLVGGR